LNIADDLVKAFNDGYKQGKIDAVVRGEWITADDIGDCCYRCSECEFIRDAYLLDIGSYCPNCGARMDGERRNDDA
jgi:hypothetical protein